jgi:hypothetical protein
MDGTRTAQRGLIGTLALTLVLTSLAFAQTTGGISGWITDASGAGLSGVSVEIAGPNLQGRRVALTAKDGTYRFPAVPPGPYDLRASLPGFASFTKEVTVALDANSVVSMVLSLEVREDVRVSGATPPIDSTSTTTGTTYPESVISHLPVGRNYADIVRANPGVFGDKGMTQGRSIALSIYGATSAENQWVIDGVNTTNVAKGTQGKAINVEFIQEVEVKTGGYQAEYGRALGGVINVITKSGGNTFHGDAFVYYDSAALQSKRVFRAGEDSAASGMRLANYRRADFGLDLGGFLLKDRLWFFGAYDRIEFPAKVSRYVASSLVPETLEFPLNGTDNLYSGKLTWNIASGSTLVATVFADPTTNSGAGRADPRQGSNTFIVREITNPDPGTWESSRRIGAMDYGLRGNQILGPAGLVTVQAARHQDRYELVPTGAGLRVRLEDFTCVGGTRDAPCDFPAEPNLVSGGLGLIGGPENHSASHRNQLRADTNLYLGPHEIKFGADYQDARTHAVAFYSGGQQVTRFNEYGQVYYEHDFYSKSATDLSAVNQDFRAGVREVGAYVQDSWKIAPGLTVDAGIRWDEEDIRDFRDVPVIRLRNEWQPRLGVVWDPRWDGTMKLYAFGGRFYYSLPTDISARSFGTATYALTYNFDPVDVTPSPNVYKHESPPSFVGTSLPPVDKGLKGVSLDEYTLGVERLLGRSLSLGLKATYRTLRNTVEDRCDLDYVSPENNGSICAIENPGSSGQYSRGDFHYCIGLDAPYNNCTFDPTTDQVLYGATPVPRARRIYRGIELLVRESLSSRLWLQASYAFSSLRGNYDGGVNQDFNGQTSPGINNDFDYPAFFSHNLYGRLYLDRPHSLRLDGFYATPFGLSVGLETWVRSGPPLDKNGYFNAGHAFFGGYPIQLVPRGYAGRMPTEWDANLKLEYPIRFGPLTVSLQGYLYNAFNNQIRTGQDTVWSNRAPTDYPNSLFDPNQEQSNPNYGRVTTRSDPRLFRAAVRVSF